MRNTLKHVIEDSQNHEKKQQADVRNRRLVQKNPQPLIPGAFLHGTSIDFLPDVLTNGDRSGDLLGLMKRADATPFAADFSEVSGQETKAVLSHMQRYASEEALNTLSQKNEFERTYAQSLAAGYGAKSDLDRRQSIDVKAGDLVTLIFDRSSPQAFLKGTEYKGPMDEKLHKLVLVGLPATEVSGLIVNGREEKTLTGAKEHIARNGFYVPIYDVDGTLLYTPDQYDAQRTETLNQPAAVAA